MAEILDREEELLAEIKRLNDSLRKGVTITVNFPPEFVQVSE